MYASLSVLTGARALKMAYLTLRSIAGLLVATALALGIGLIARLAWKRRSGGGW